MLASYQNLCKKVIKSVLSFPGVVSLDKASAEKALDIISRDIIALDGVRITKKDTGLIIDVHIVVKYGTKIPQLSWELQKKINKDINNTSEDIIEEINIHIEGVERDE